MIPSGRYQHYLYPLLRSSSRHNLNRSNHLSLNHGKIWLLIHHGLGVILQHRRKEILMYQFLQDQLQQQ